MTGAMTAAADTAIDCDVHPTVPGMQALLDFPPDMARVPMEPNRLSNQVLVQTFEQEWGQVQQ